MQYVVSTAALDMLGFILSHIDAQKALGRIIEPDVTMAWDLIALHLPGVNRRLHEPVPSEMMRSPSRDNFYAFVYFSAIRDVAMVMKAYLRDLISQYYIPNPTEDNSWFSSWRIFCGYTNIDIESIPEAPAVSEIFEIDDLLFCRDYRSPIELRKFGVMPMVESLENSRAFVSAVDEMVTHDLSKKGKKI